MRRRQTRWRTRSPQPRRCGGVQSQRRRHGPQCSPAPTWRRSAFGPSGSQQPRRHDSRSTRRAAQRTFARSSDDGAIAAVATAPRRSAATGRARTSDSAALRLRSCAPSTVAHGGRGAARARASEGASAHPSYPNAPHRPARGAARSSGAPASVKVAMLQTQGKDERRGVRVLCRYGMVDDACARRGTWSVGSEGRPARDRFMLVAAAAQRSARIHSQRYTRCTNQSLQPCPAGNSPPQAQSGRRCAAAS